MLFKATKEIYNALCKDGDLKVFTEENEKNSNVWLQFGIKNGGSYRIKFISSDDDNDVAVRVFSLISIEEEQKAKALPIINEFNCKYRYAKFYIDDDGDLNISYDYPVNCQDPAASSREIVIRLVKIIDASFALLMHAIWS